MEIESEIEVKVRDILCTIIKYFSIRYAFKMSYDFVLFLSLIYNYIP